VVWATAAVPAAQAQSGFAGAGLGLVVAGGRGVGPGDCLEAPYNLGLGVRGGVDVVGSALALQASARAHRWRVGPQCVVDGFPPPDGTYPIDDYQNLTEDRFALTDVGIRGTLTGVGAGGMIGLAVGNAWRSGPNAPYVMAAAGVFLQVQSVRLVLGAELYRLRLTFDRFERTWQGGQVTRNVPLGTVHEWNSAGIVTLGAELLLGH